MPQHALQIALEHHRAGRLVAAETGYLALLEQNPDDFDAAHWLGVLRVQAGQPEEAIALLERAAAARPGDAAFVYNLGQAYLNSGRIDDAVAAFDRALSLDAAGERAAFSAATARLARQAPGDADAALALLEQARWAGMESAELDQNLGVALLMLGRIDQAVAACLAAIGKRPDYAEAHYHLGVAQQRKADLDKARRSLERAIELQPAYFRAIQGLAVVEAEAGRLAQAELLLRRAIALRPNSAAAHQGLGMVLQKMGRANEATLAFVQAVRAAKAPAAANAQARTASPKNAPVISNTPASASVPSEALSLQSPDESPASAVADLERKLTPSPAAAALHYRLAKQTSLIPPAQIPADAVSTLFDKYADVFDEHLRGKLDYRVPELLVEAIKKVLGNAKRGEDASIGVGDVLDLGCGTGLCGPLLRPIAKSLGGVDLSPAMIEKARERGVYDHLKDGDFLDLLLRARRSFDLLAAADVLTYLGDLAPTFEAAANALRDGGLLAFTVESGAGERFQFNKETHRFTHSSAYIRHLATIFGFEEAFFADVVARQEAGEPVNAHIVVWRLKA